MQNVMRRAFVFHGNAAFENTKLQAKTDLLHFLRLQAEIKVARDKIVLYMSSIMRIQATYRVWKNSQNDMILRIT